MKILSLDNYISEKKSIRPLTVKQIKSFDPYSYHPETKDELREIIFNRMKEEGNECDLNDIDTSKITDMSFLFSKLDEDGRNIRNNLSDFNGDISRWDVSNVEDMNNMFWCAESFDCDISKWDVSNVEDMSFMFCRAESFNGNISGWDVSKVENMDGMFYRATSFDKDISKWNVSNVEYIDFIFASCPLQNYPEKQPKFNI